MAFKLKEAVFRVRCREPGCPFVSDFLVKENLQGATEADVDSEAWKLAKDLGINRHDAIHGKRHSMMDPDIHKIRSSYETIGGVPRGKAPAAPARLGETINTRRYDRSDRIIVKGERATTVCEVVRGSARNVHRPSLVYRPGSTFGAAGLFENKRRMADIVAAENGTIIAFYDMRELWTSDREKAKELSNEAMEDIFRVLAWLEDRCDALEKQLAQRKAGGAVKKGGRKPAKKAAAKRSKKKAAKKPVKKPAKRR
ncbi:MAG: cyclic nucleotide-binding domain-containing protein [Spirochaetes bacterium]|nr:cyclic nucleotide-binding domain-containing protein [Spirochaetota bacterium]